MQFVERMILYSEPKIKTKMFEEFDKLILLLTPDEFLKLINSQKYHTLCEYFNNISYVRPYYDYDKIIETFSKDKEYLPINMLISPQLKDVEEKLFQNVLELLHPNHEIALAERHGLKPNPFNENEINLVISFRAYVKGVKIKINRVIQYIMDTMGSIPPNFDVSVYDPDYQTLAVIYGHKTPDDSRILIPITHRQEPLAFIAQYMYGNEVTLESETPAGKQQDNTTGI